MGMLPMANDETRASRRDVLGHAALAALASVGDVSGQTPAGMPPDPPRVLRASQADLGTLYPEVDRLAGLPGAPGQPYPLSFVRERFRSLDDFRAAAKPRVLRHLNYAPPIVPA